MPPKPHRALVDRVSGYADEASAFMRRRRLTRQPFARLYVPGGGSRRLDSETEAGRELFRAASRVLDAARE